MTKIYVSRIVRGSTNEVLDALAARGEQADGAPVWLRTKREIYCRDSGDVYATGCAHLEQGLPASAFAGDNAAPIEVQDVQSCEFGGKDFGDMLDASGRLYERTTIQDPPWGGIECYEYDSPRFGRTWAYEMICQYDCDGFAQVLVNLSAPIHGLDLGSVGVRLLLKRIEREWDNVKCGR